ncbi:MAG: TauD/TfdA family dioxygenase [Pseudomonadota bacterium]
MSQTIYETQKTYPKILSNGRGLSNFYFDYGQFVKDHALDASHIIRNRMNSDGIVIVKNANLKKSADIEEWANIWGSKQISYAGGTNSRESMGGSVLTVGTEPPHINVAAHNEMSYTYYDLYPRIFMLGCVTAPRNKGETIFADNVGITEALLKSRVGKKFYTHGVRYVRNYFNADDPAQAPTGLHHWQGAFNTTKKFLVERSLRKKNVDHFEWFKNGSLRFSYYKPAFEWDEILNMNLAFVSIGNHGYWFRNWEPYCTLPDDMRPHHMTFGNGDPLTEEDIQELVFLTIENSLEHQWEDNDLVILDNLRFTHARKPFRLESDEKREIYVAMRLPRQRHGFIGDKLGLVG